LIDTGAQISLVKKVSLKESIPKTKFKEINVSIQGINGGDMRIKEGIMLRVNDGEEMLFYVVENLPRILDIILGQECLFQNDYVMTRPNAILPFSESVVKVPSRKRGVRFIEEKNCFLGFIVAVA
jgi:hypothetical protein